jgi:5-methylcytosine-specific restriction enzyme A
MCAEHQAKQDKVNAQYRAKYLEEKYGKPSERGYDHAWRKLKDALLLSQPECACGRPSQVVHHVVPLKQGGERLDPANCAVLCASCHQRTHRDAHHA